MHPRVAEYLFFFVLQLIWCVLGVIIWIIAAYSNLAGLITLIIAPLVLLMPAIFVPIFSRKVRVWMARWRERGSFHKYDWNIFWGLLAIVSCLMTFVMIMFAPSLWWAWTHTIVQVPNNVTYADVSAGAAFKFDHSWIVNVSMMGGKERYACDDSGCSAYFNCFAPIVQSGQLGPNIFWAFCPYNKQNCSESLALGGPCFSLWNQTSDGGVITSSGEEPETRDAIQATAQSFGMPPSPPTFLCLQWEDVEQIYRRAFFFWILSLGIGQGAVLLWILLRRILLAQFCGPYNNPNYKTLS